MRSSTCRKAKACRRWSSGDLTLPLGGAGRAEIYPEIADRLLRESLIALRLSGFVLARSLSIADTRRVLRQAPDAVVDR